MTTPIVGWAVALALLLSACSSQVQPPAPIPAPSGSPLTVVDGPATAEALTKRYSDIAQDCGSASRPAFLCNGVILRTTTYSPRYDAWNPSPTAVRLGAVSFSYLRQDSKFARMPWGGENGMVLYPIFASPPDKIDIAVLCSYPIDGWTDGRVGNRCGQYGSNPTSVSCELQGITSAAQWTSLYTQQGGDNTKICAFNVRDGQNYLAGPAFYQSLLAKSSGNPTDKRFTEHNELVHGLWEQNIPAQLPIQAFFYTTPAGLKDAWQDRLTFRHKANIDLPLIKITLPTSTAEQARFDYIAADNIDPPLGLDATAVALTGKTYLIPDHPGVAPVYTPGSNAVERHASGGKMPYTYASSNPGVAAVDPYGLVTAKGNGTAQISVTDATGQTRAYTVNVSNVLKVYRFPKSNWNNASRAVAAQGARLPSEQEAHELKATYGGRWPFAHAYHWTAKGCGLGKHLAVELHNSSVVGMCASFITSYEVVGLKP
ncbi:Ig-like domain-containing protein [Pseudomonas sp. LAM2023]|uniref:Ig-like domain-containing protein n=1 Tax=Pseudomonas sp. LAM2023 TaxID=2800477 RepID=UPI00190CAE64|nr:Ig-like domain-containing protein [Pseudomonas sp. LAM2023]